MADLRDADILQIIARQPRQHRSVDRVVAKGRLVLVQPQATQPGRDIHAAPLSGLDARSSARRRLVQRNKAVLNVEIGSAAAVRRGRPGDRRTGWTADLRGIDYVGWGANPATGVKPSAPCPTPSCRHGRASRTYNAPMPEMVVEYPWACCRRVPCRIGWLLEGR